MTIHESMTSMYTNTTESFNFSEDVLNTTQNNVTNKGNSLEVARIIIMTTFPVIILFGTVGNLLTFVVMQRGSLKHSSTCCYMAILALADTGKCYHLLSFQ